jgi:hypothetical protein
MQGKQPANKSQIDQFRETARELETDESGDAMERAFRKIVPPKRRDKDPEIDADC